MRRTSSLFLLLAASCFALLCACGAPELPSAASADSGYSFVLQSDPESGCTPPFSLHRLGYVQFVFDNTDGDQPLTLTLHKRGFLHWSVPRSLGDSETYSIPAGEAAVLTLGTENLSAGRYRFESNPVPETPYRVSVFETAQSP